MTARVVFHLPEDYFDRYHKARHLALYPAVEAIIRRRGGQITLARRPGKPLDDAARRGDGNLHIVESGQVQGHGYLNAALAYLPGFWHLDPQGVLADSSMQSRRFDPGEKCHDVAAAAVFYHRLQQEFAVARRSRYGQAPQRADLPQGCIAVFLQGPLPQRRGQAHLSYADMLRAAVQAAEGRPVLAKAHPLQKELGQAAIAQVQEEGHAILATEANVHDLLAAACVSVSVNSAAAIEGFLHGTPAILCGRSDYACMVETVTRPGDFPQALCRALSTPRDYPLWFHWYFARHCLALEDPDFESRLLHRFADAGFDSARLGLD